jgi:hypothetical protein
MDIETKIFLDEIIHQLVILNKNIKYIAEDIAGQKAMRDNILRKETVNNVVNKLS